MAIPSSDVRMPSVVGAPCFERVLQGRGQRFLLFIKTPLSSGSEPPKEHLFNFEYEIFRWIGRYGVGERI